MNYQRREKRFVSSPEISNRLHTRRAYDLIVIYKSFLSVNLPEH
jgi:hypothetical protein